MGRVTQHSFSNWSGSVSFTPHEIVHPADEDEVVDRVRRAAEEGTRIRPVGTGHSSSKIMVTPDTLMSLDHLTGVTDHDTDVLRAKVLPGTGLEDLGEQLAEHGLAMENLGDVDYQAIAGAVGTGTHGTGERMGNLSSTLVGGRLVTGTGEVVPFGEDAGADADDDLLRAVQVSLGALGVLTSLTLRVLPAYDLHRRNWKTPIGWALEHFDELAAINRHLDVYWYPRSDIAQVRTMNPPGEEPDLTPPGELHREETGHSYDIITNQREIVFEEIEYMLPRDVALEVFEQVRRRVLDRHRKEVAWRVLLRTVAADRSMLSPFYERETMTIALLHNTSLPYADYFFDIEPILLEAGGRPHWGKKHTGTRAHLEPMYPEWDAFARLRAQLDPRGVFASEDLDELLGPVG